jgi:hypothetical protein
MRSLRMPFILFCMGLFVYNMLTMTRWVNDLQQGTALRARILAHVGTHLDGVAVSLDQLTAAGVLSADDVAFLDTSHSEYHPVSARSPDDAVFFTTRAGNLEWRYYKAGGESYELGWVSPDEAYIVINAPDRQAPSRRLVKLMERGTGKVLASRALTSPAPRNDTHWSPDSRFVVLNVPLASWPAALDLVECLPVFEVSAGTARTIPLPDAVRPERLLAPSEAGKNVEWDRYWLMAEGWRVTGELQLKTEAIGHLSGPHNKPAGDVALVYHFVVRLADGTASVLEKSCQTYSVSAD